MSVRPQDIVLVQAMTGFAPPDLMGLYMCAILSTVLPIIEFRSDQDRQKEMYKHENPLYDALHKLEAEMYWKAVKKKMEAAREQKS